MSRNNENATESLKNTTSIMTSKSWDIRHCLESKHLLKLLISPVDLTVSMRPCSVVMTSSPVSSHRKPKTKRSKRFLESRAPKLVEDVKRAMIMKGGNTSQTITQALKDIVSYLPVSQLLALVLASSCVILVFVACCSLP